MKSYQADRFQVGQRVVVAWPCEPGQKGKRATVVGERRMRGAGDSLELFSYLLMIDGDTTPHVAWQEELRAIEEVDLESSVEEMAG